MTPEQKLKWAVLVCAAEWNETDPPPYPCEDVDELYSALEEKDSDSITDAKYELRGGEVETKLTAPYSRHYESKEVAMKFPDGSWVGWTYWYGGGKHGEPQEIDWIEYAYDVDCDEEEKTVIVQTFTKKDSE